MGPTVTHYTFFKRGHLPTEKDMFTPQRYCHGYVDDDDDDDLVEAEMVVQGVSPPARVILHIVEILPFHFPFCILSVAYVCVL